MVNRCSAVPARNRAIEPSIGTESSPWTKATDKPEATSTTSPMAKTLLVMISKGVTGMATTALSPT